MKSAVSHRMAHWLGSAIAFLVRQREKLEQFDNEGSDRGAAAEQDEKTRAAEVSVPETRRRPLLMFLLGVMLLLIGIVTGSLFSFSLFAHKIESQSDFIANQADEVFEYDKETRRAERALEKSRTEAKVALQQLEEISTELQQAKTRLAEIEGRATLYGSKQESPASLMANTAIPARSTVHRSVPGKSSNDTCNLQSGSARSDLSRCLDLAR